MYSAFFEKHRDIGFLIVRVGIGIMFMYHGQGKLLGGPEVWKGVGSSISYIGINFGHTFFGFMAALSEFGGGICLILGLFFRMACFFMFFTMCVAANLHFSQGDGLKIASHAIEAGILFLGLMFIGSGPYSLDEKLKICKK